MSVAFRSLSACFRGALVLLALTGSAGAADPPWKAAGDIRNAGAELERLMYRDLDEDTREQARDVLSSMDDSYTAVLAGPYREAAPRIHEDVVAAIGAARRAVEASSAPAAASARNALWTALLHGSYRLTMRAFEAGDLERAKSWLGIREYARAASNASAYEAMDAALAGRMPPERAQRIVQDDLHLAYASQMRRALKEVEKAAAKDYQARAAGWAASARGYFAIVAPNLADRRGPERRATVRELLDALNAAALAGELRQVPGLIGRLDEALLGYTPVELDDDELQRQARLLIRFLGLVHTEYKDGVRNGEISIPIEYHEARLFRDRSEMLFEGLQGEILARSEERSARLRDVFDEMQRIIEAKGPAADIKALSREGAATVSEVLGIEEGVGGYKVALQLLPSILDEMVLLADAGDYAGAELKRLEAYSWFDPDVEQRLFPRSPSLSLALESRFWEGTVGSPGLMTLLKDRSPVDELTAAAESTKERLEEAREVLVAEVGPFAAFVQSLAIILREGVEAILVIAALLGVLRAMGTRGYPVYIWGGVGTAVAASFATWYAADHLIAISTVDRELLEGVTGLLAAAVLVYVTHWIFHKTYVVDWMTYVKEHVREAASTGRLVAIATLSFFVVYREGFETVLFYEALMADAPPLWVVAGFAAGILATGGLAYALLRLGLRIPIRAFFSATGVVLMLLAVIFVGNGIRGLQTAGLVSATLVPGFPEWPFLQIYFGFYPLAEPLAAQAALILMFAASWMWLRRSSARRAATADSPRPG